jgi:aromatic-amino-acid transaminase
MVNFIMAENNSRSISGEDKIFGINKKAQEMIRQEGKDKVANATIGSLLDDQGNLIILSSVSKVLKQLKPEDYAEYAPIVGIPSYLDAVKKALFMDYIPNVYLEAVATPGGTGAIRNTIQNYSKRGDKILTSDWHWSPYKTIAEELEREIDTYPFFDSYNRFNSIAFEEKVMELLHRQNRLVVIINTPAHNPTGYSLTDEDWDMVVSIAKDAIKDSSKKIILLVDVAYIDFAGDPKKYRSFLTKLEGLPQNILPIIAFSMSKSFTLYGMRGGAMICMTPDRDIAEEFKSVNSFSCRGTWSNCNRSAMVVLSRIYSDKALLEEVIYEREAAQKLLIQRGRTFMEAAYQYDLDVCPYDSGFFVIVNCNNPDSVAQELFKEGIFTVPFGNRGLRVSVASISSSWCKTMPHRMTAAIERING